MNNYVLSEEAELDIDEIYDFGVYKFGTAQAATYLNGFEEHVETLGKNSDMGRHRREIKKGLYSLPYASHIFFYRKLDTKIRIVRILYGGRDLMKFLD